MLKSRVTDGSRTRDNRIHNPQRKWELRALSLLARAYEALERRAKVRRVAPGPGMTDADVFDALRRVTS